MGGPLLTEPCSWSSPWDLSWRYLEACMGGPRNHWQEKSPCSVHTLNSASAMRLPLVFLMLEQCTVFTKWVLEVTPWFCTSWWSLWGRFYCPQLTEEEAKEKVIYSRWQSFQQLESLICPPDLMVSLFIENEMKALVLCVSLVSWGSLSPAKRKIPLQSLHFHSRNCKSVCPRCFRIRYIYICVL